MRFTFCRLPFTIALAAALAGCGGPERDLLTFSGSAVGREGEILRNQLARFAAERGIEVRVRQTPDSADQRHQLYVQWLNARASEPDVLQLDVIWTPEFAAAGWLLPLDRFQPEHTAFFPAAIAANRWRGVLYGLPWFMDVGMLYWRTDIFDRPPGSFDELTAGSRRAMREGRTRFGIAWQAARYEGLVTVFLEILGGFGGRIMSDDGAVEVDSDAAVRALTWMRDAIHRDAIAPASSLTWHEEEARFAFQNGSAAAMRNWPYAFPLLQAEGSRVAASFAVAPMPRASDGVPTAALGGSQLAINARTSRPDDAWALIAFLTAPAQMVERRTVVGQFPSRMALYEGDEHTRRIIEAARPRPVTPVYTQLSEILQVRLHRALTRQQEPGSALRDAAREMRALLDRTGLSKEPRG